MHVPTPLLVLAILSPIALITIPTSQLDRVIHHRLCRTTGPVCNGHADLCNRSYGNITFAGSHDSFTFTNDTLQLARDQEVDIPTQLDFGIRLLQAQSHLWLGALHFCHTSNNLDGGKVADYLTIVANFLDNNPNDVLTLLFTNPEGVSFPDVWAPLFESAGLVKYAYVPPRNPMPQSAWPTLGEMIANGERLVVFIDYVGKDGRTVDYLLPEFGMIWETPYDMTDPSLPCSIDRIRGADVLSASNQMYLINHEIDIIVSGALVSDPVDAPTTNSVTSIIAHANRCLHFANGRNPNFILFDFINLGEIFKAVDQLNRL
ncbi:PLC-like phosphodiesterase [Russula earlei]|uniref:PLC-like phosphodiesterase n=1 Tax=Russula earlei TaxID=71964 RepID=A0ACC0UN41_9AGAM|nr:PLC-like phosphodiesterase [Russula earlei]